MLPALLIAEGYDKVIVTQPRRLPCQLICNRVNQTMMIERDKKKSEVLAGWAVSGTERHPDARVLYLTDGLLKERLLYDSNLITTNTQLNKSVVFFIDEVHERSVNIDLCLALLARMLAVEPQLKTKMKVIISSATLDKSVPDLFRQIPNISLAEFQMPKLGTLFPVKTIPRPGENALDIVQEICKTRKRHDQILCFVNSVTEVNQSCHLIKEISGGTIVAHPLVQSQHPNVQQEFIENGTVFFSTTVAETSLTFPCLKYVIDTGVINVPFYDHDLKKTELKEVRAAESTIKQRLGRLGRTQPGEYYALYRFKAEDLPYPIPQICQSDLVNIEFSLRKSPIQKGFSYMKQFLANPPSQKIIDRTVEEIRNLGELKICLIMESRSEILCAFVVGIIDKGSSERLTPLGEQMAKLPDFGSLEMGKAILAGLVDYDCGHDMICLGAILGVLNTTAILKTVPQSMKHPSGDFMSLLNVMNVVLLAKQAVPATQFNLDQVCSSKGLTSIQHVIRQALRRYQTLEKIFNQSKDFRRQAQNKSGDWQYIAKSLLAGYSNNVFVSMKELKDRLHWFVRYDGKGALAKLDLQSTLTKKVSEAPVALILAKDIRYSSAIRDLAIISFLGQLEPDWLEFKIARELDLSPEEEAYLNSDNRYSTAHSKFSSRIQMGLTNRKVSLMGQAATVLNAELHLRQEMVSEMKFELADLITGSKHANFDRNFEIILKMTRIFKPMRWRWAAEKQVEITINSNTATKTCEITVKGRDSENRKVKAEFEAFLRWLQSCAVIRHPDDGKCLNMGDLESHRAMKFSQYDCSLVTDSSLFDFSCVVN